MATVAPRRQMRFSWSAAVAALAAVTFLFVAWRFVIAEGPGTMGRHPANGVAYVLHIAGGALALSVAPFQFIAPIRNRFRAYHRWAGYAFVVGSVMTFVGFWIFQPGRTDLFRTSQATAITLWMIAMGAAVVAARRKRMLTHQHNMARAFVLAAYFVVVRHIDPMMGTLGPWLSQSRDAANAHSDWIAWVVPLIAVEAYYGVRWDRLLKRRDR